MAWIRQSSVRLSISESTGASNVVLVNLRYELNFETFEVRENTTFRLRSYLMEEDAGRDYFVMNPNGRPLRLTRGKERDDVAQILEEVWIKPNSKQQHDIEISKPLDIQYLPSRPWSRGGHGRFEHIVPGGEDDFVKFDFFAFVSIIPQAAIGDWELSNKVTVWHE